jgi:two-component system phosphate regulon response regulator PhoB
MAKEKILVVEDDKDIVEVIKYNLTKEGYQVTCTLSAEAALKTLEENIPDLILLDLMLPGMDGLEFCRIIRNKPEFRAIPIIMLTARSEETDIVVGLEVGAGDYITKPFSPRVLIARIKNVLRRKTAEPESDESPIKIGSLAIWPGKYEVYIDDKPVDLTNMEFQILHLFTRRRGWVFTRYQIVNAIKGEDYPVTDRSVDVQIVGLRKKLGKYKHYIKTVRGVGYKFDN